jgi:hypothetical protein
MNIFVKISSIMSGGTEISKDITKSEYYSVQTMLHKNYNSLNVSCTQRIEGNLDASWGVCNKCIFYGKNGTFITLFLPLVILVL